MIISFLNEIVNRLSLIEDLTIETEFKQLLENMVPVCFVDLTSNKPVSDDVFPRYQKKVKSNLKFALIVYHNSIVNLIDLIENIESVMNITEPFSDSIELSYAGYDFAPKEFGNKHFGSIMNFTVTYIKTF